MTIIRPYVFAPIASYAHVDKANPELTHTWERFGPPAFAVEEDAPVLRRYGGDDEYLDPDYAIRCCRYAIKVDTSWIAQASDVELQVGNLGRDRHLLMLNPDVVAAETYGAPHAAERIAELLGERVPWQTPYGPAHVNLRQAPSGGPVTLVKAVLLGGMWATNYAHWLLEILPKLRFRELWLADTWGPLILPPELPTFALETLRAHYAGAIGNLSPDWAPHAVLPAAPGDYYRFQALTIPSHIAPGGYSREQVRWLRRNIGDYLVPDFAHRHLEPTGRIYISRSDAQSRRVVNEEALVARLTARGFTVHTLSGLTVAQQVELFAGARTIVAPHGAGLANIVWANDARLLELVPAQARHPMYWILAGLHDFPYARIPCPASDAGHDMTVNLDTVDRMLDLLEGLE